MTCSHLAEGCKHIACAVQIVIIMMPCILVMQTMHRNACFMLIGVCILTPLVDGCC